MPGGPLNIVRGTQRNHLNYRIVAATAKKSPELPYCGGNGKEITLITVLWRQRQRNHLNYRTVAATAKKSP
jgi:hypothetical protein